MPDSFFATQKPRKRKRDASSSGPGRSSSTTGQGHRGPKAPRPNGTHSATTNGRPSTNGAGPSRTRGGKTRSAPPKQRRDEELSGSDDEGGDGAGGGDLDSLRASTPSIVSASEDESETPAQKRLRLAQLYLKQVEAEEREKAELGGWDAEELDKEIIGERLRKDVAEDAGKVCVFVGERVRISSWSQRSVFSSYTRLRQS
jgi:ribosomal RNA-processing protein 9